MNKAVFLDRDGVINRERGEYTFRVEDFEFLDGVEEALKTFGERGYLLIIISNQSGIAKGLYGIEDVEKINTHILNYFKAKNIDITEIYYCPHHDDYGKCLCRKPAALMLEKALARFQIDPASSYMIGDMDRDIEAATKLGIKGIKILPNSIIPLNLE